MKEKKTTENEIHTLSIRDLGVHGEGIGVLAGLTLFVPGALPEEVVTLRIIEKKKKYAVGELIHIEKESPYRRETSCIPDVTCGACGLSHMSYEGQLKYKEKRVKSVITRIAKEDEGKVLSILPSPKQEGYRNKMAIPVGTKNGQIVLGYYKRGTHEIIPSTHCQIQNETNNHLAAFAEDFLRRHHLTAYDEKTGKGTFRHIVGRIGDDGTLMAILITATETLPEETAWIEEMRKQCPTLVSLYHNVQNKRNNVILGKDLRLLWGKETLSASMGDLHFDISPHAFFQVNKEQAENLYETALTYAGLTRKETVIDAYCGTGTISLYLAQKAKRVMGIEIVDAAIQNAKKNAKKNHIENVEFHTADVAHFLPRWYEKGNRADVIVLDPVRAGCDEKVIEAIGHMSPERIVYVSCNVATLARDIARLTPYGYSLQKVKPVDMFPHTPHVEAVALIEKSPPSCEDRQAQAKISTEK